MKKVLIAIFAFLYMGTAVGASVQLHYCMGKLADWGIGHTASKTCNKCGMDKAAKEKKGCCKDDHKFFKNTTDQSITDAAVNQMQVIAVAIPVTFFNLPDVDIINIAEENPSSHAPPRKSDVAVYIRNCIFLL